MGERMTRYPFWMFLLAPAIVMVGVTLVVAGISVFWCYLTDLMQ